MCRSALGQLSLRPQKKASLVVGKKVHWLRTRCYFGKSIKQETTVEDMNRLIYATLRHCQSTNNKPQHNTCPDGEMSWCFYKRAIAENQPIPPKKEKMTTYLREGIVAKIMPVYMRLARTELLQKCKGDTQNTNECSAPRDMELAPQDKVLLPETYDLRRVLCCGPFQSWIHGSWGSWGRARAGRPKRLEEGGQRE